LVGLIEFSVYIEQREVRDRACFQMRVFEMHERADGDNLSARLSYQAEHFGDDFARAHYIVNEYAFEAARVEVLAKVVLAFVFFGPENLVRIERFAYAERYGYATGCGRYDGAIGQRRQHFRFFAKQT